MSGRDEELLSAYIDGELSGDERSSVEQWLADDVAAREFMDELAETSAMVRALPRAAAPADLRHDVLARLRAARPAPPVPAARPHWRRRAVWLATSAAGLMLAVVLYRTWQPTDDVRVAGQPSSAMLGVDAKADGLTRTAESVVMNAATPAMTVDLPDTGTVTDPAAWSTNDFSDPPQDVVAVALSNADVLQQKLEVALEQGGELVPGEAVQQLGKIGDQVVIFRYRVVDRQDMFDKVQYVLNQNGIVSVDSQGDDEAFFAEGDGRLQAIYLDTPTPNFDAAVNEITKLDTVTAVTTNTFADDATVHRFELLRAVESEAERLRELSRARTDARFAATEESEVLRRSASEPAPADAPAVLSDESSPQNPPAKTPALSYQKESSAEAAAAEGGEATKPDENGNGIALDSYQVRVPARQHLLDELLVEFDDLSDRSETRQLAAGTPVAQSGKMRVQSWIVAGRKDEGQVPSDRVRAVILLVPENRQ